MQNGVDAVLLLRQARQLEATLLRPAPRAPCHGDGERVQSCAAAYASNEVLESLC